MPNVQDRVSDLLMALRGYLQLRLDEIQSSALNRTVIGNISRPDSDGIAGPNTTHPLTDSVVITLVRMEEDPTRKNQRNYRVNPLATDNSDGILYRNPPVGLNLYVLITANHNNYLTALTILSNVVAVFQNRNRVPDEPGVPWPANALYSERSLKLTLLSPTFEEHNHLWSMLGGKQVPSALYLLQTANVELVPDTPLTGPPVTEIVLNETIT
ncbi:DUF4255 domain-containing protein [Neolewinella litorea]|uniref:DUF4255 domain-containing protein n=1 Tax=Neolewinella litorea TaxID=2562452 RepID=A0A4S4NKR5_9BACT|nr:DUF4255 domain-containing protein [Neolewinella litorea]THH39417.1 DUF4255 domain-containing protein [Neolewinella litorea]